MTVILDSAAAHSFALGGAVATALRGLEWNVTEGAFYSGGAIDVAARKVWKNRSIQAAVRLAVFSDGGQGRELVFAQAPVSERSLASYSLGDDVASQREAIRRALAPHADAAAALQQLHDTAYPRERALVHAAHVPPPPARAQASSFRQLDGTNGFEQAATAAFAALEAIHADLLRFDLDVILDDLTLFADPAERTGHAAGMLADGTASCDLLHAIVVTEAPLSLLANASRVASVPWLRLVRTALLGGGATWIDVVQSSAIDDYTSTLTRHYDAQFKRRKFERA